MVLNTENLPIGIDFWSYKKNFRINQKRCFFFALLTTYVIYVVFMKQWKKVHILFKSQLQNQQTVKIETFNFDNLGKATCSKPSPLANHGEMKEKKLNDYGKQFTNYMRTFLLVFFFCGNIESNRVRKIYNVEMNASTTCCRYLLQSLFIKMIIFMKNLLDTWM